MAVDTIQSSIGHEVKRQAKTQVKLNASNSKFILLLYKVMKVKPDLKPDGFWTFQKKKEGPFGKVWPGN